ncbi:glucose-1-phosphate cytidylyltransferase [Bacillus sp. FJAT-27225]|uniref:glucose-1-phosphate cytidylyltransferase n=1 Tax=Bacillus sp. FJAT-27225 TaxID=1743144 RepID=UPI00080C2E11|nr:glucose-1-phosphate cytidylyltransferase [Bacillus sp. FJAT-27225]OCA83306.1 glucose-1-phosphate cytidylyltransferase [Bacillus sp. FJAT-27225]
MKVVILAGGFGTRISEETHTIPKPLITIGDHPILWHIMKIYSTYGFNDFVICLGYKGYKIKEFFLNYLLNHSDFSIDLSNSDKPVIYNHSSEPWKVTLIDTGQNTLTGGRIKRIQQYIGDEPFMLTYGDGLADINVKDLLDFHKSHGKLATVTAIQPEGRFGSLHITEGDSVSKMQEKLPGDGMWVNGGFFICQPEVFGYIEGDQTIFEREPLETLASSGELVAFKHRGFWQPMDTLKEKRELDQLWQSNKAPWKKWA